MKSRKLKLVTLLSLYWIRDVSFVSYVVIGHHLFLFFALNSLWKNQYLVVLSSLLFDSKISPTLLGFILLLLLSLFSNKKLHFSSLSNLLLFLCQRVYIPHVHSLPSASFFVTAVVEFVLLLPSLGPSCIRHTSKQNHTTSLFFPFVC